MLTERSSQISTLLATFKDKKGLEVEAKFGSFQGGNFKSTVPYFHFSRLLTRVTESGAVPKVFESTVAVSGNVRRISTPDSVSWQTKTKVKDFDFKEYDIRLSVNLEQEIQPVIAFVPEVVRERTRHSFIFGPVTLDLTEVMMATSEGVARASYEVELEFTGENSELPYFFEWTETVFKALKGTHLLYTNSEKQALIKDTNAVFGFSGPVLKKEVLVEARNIKKRDLVYGGVVGNKSAKDSSVLTSPGRGTRYAVTFKADGLRKLFMIHSSGLWLVYPSLEFNLVVKRDPANKNLLKLLDNFSGTVLDGELVILKAATPVLHTFLAFDCLAFQGNKDIQKQNYVERRKIVDALSKAVRLESISVLTKDTKILNTPEEFFKTVSEFLDKREKLPYLEDGLMFIPVDAVYNPKSERFPLRERVLTNVPDTCKWKEQKDITIDFEIKWLLGGKLELYSYDSEKGKLVKFVGDVMHPLTEDMIEHEDPLLLGKPSGLTVEFEWTGSLLRPRRIRYDKNGPNRLETALDNWEDVQSPVTALDLRGESLSLVFAYHNRIKKNLFELVKKGNILDIGSGAGGDVFKWNKNVGSVVAVEPNAKNREELVKRLAGLPELEKRVRVVPTGGEDTEAITEAVREWIPGGKVDVVSLMLSLSFFWSSQQHLDALVQTIVKNLKPGGKIIFLTIDGNSLEKYFGTATDKKIGPAEIHLFPKTEGPEGQAVDFILPGTIVGHQREYVVHLNDLTEKLSKYGFELAALEAADKEQLLSKTGKDFTSLYSYGVYFNTRPSALKEDSPKKKPQPLPFLPVSGVPTQGKAFTGDDATAPLKCSWFSGLVRIATIGDGNCFVHSLLKAFYAPYQENSDSYFRDTVAKEVRRDLAVALNFENPEYPGHTYWETTGNGIFVELALGQMVIGELEEGEQDYSLYGLQRLFNSMNELGDEVYHFVSDILDINIFVLRADSEDLYEHSSVVKEGRDSVVIVGNGVHYEVVALKTEEGFQTLFTEEDPFFQTLKKKFNVSYNREKYSPKENLKKTVDVLQRDNPGKNVREILRNNFADDDPIKQRL